MNLFVTGTDTGVGKTHVTALLARAGVAKGLKVLAYKPIETGVVGSLGEDQQILIAAAGNWQTGPLAGLYQFALPAAPSVAAEAEHRAVQLDAIQSALVGVVADVVLVEGAGGWRVPITRTTDMGALACLLGFPVLVVARAGLGTINHSLLTVEAVRRDGCAVQGVVLSVHPADDVAFAQSNASEIRRMGQVPVHVLGTADLWSFCST